MTLYSDLPAACSQNPEGGLGSEPKQSEDCLQVIRCAVKPPSTPTVTHCLPPFPVECVGTTCHETSVERISHFPFIFGSMVVVGLMVCLIFAVQTHTL